MDESLVLVTGGLLDVASLVADVITDVRLTAIHMEMPAPRKVAMILHLLDETFGPEPVPGLPAWIAPGTDAGGVAAILANWVRGHPEPFTRAVEVFTGTARGSARIKADGQPVLMPAGPMERRRLSLPPGETLWWRDGWLVTDGGVTAARTRLAVVPGRVPFMDALESSDVPFGTLADGAGGLRRTARTAWPGPGASVESTALLILGRDTLPCGIAWEVAPPGFIGHLVRAAAALPAGRLLTPGELLAVQGGPAG